MAGGTHAYHVSQVVATVRSLSKFPTVLKEAGAQPIIVDFAASDEELRRAAERAIESYGNVDVLVNNAGMGVFGLVEESGESVYAFKIIVPSELNAALFT